MGNVITIQDNPRPIQGFQINELRIVFFQLQSSKQIGNAACWYRCLDETLFSKYEKYHIGTVGDIGTMRRRYLRDISGIYDDTRTIDKLQIDKLARHVFSNCDH
ncbi:MAG TPA: hypothetical protein DDX04_07325 [Massilia sp.]|nr:hypothetical protein [Massilia sp.]